MVDLMDRLNSLLKQDEEKYQCKDYLDPDFQKGLLEGSNPENLDQLVLVASSNSTSTSSQSSCAINESWREKICEWSYSVADHFDFSREVVSISMSFLDRYLSVRSVDKRLFQLAAMTTLYMTIKIYERGTISMQSMIDLSRGFFTVEVMKEMELSVLSALDWYVHPPTPFCIARHFLHMIPVSPSFPLTVRHDILEHCRFLTELSVIDYYFVTKRASYIALAALLNAMDNNRSFPIVFRNEVLKQLGRLDNFDPNDNEIAECRDRLKELYIQGGYAPNATAAAMTVDQESEQRSETESPVSVAHAFNGQVQASVSNASSSPINKW